MSFSTKSNNNSSPRSFPAILGVWKDLTTVPAWNDVRKNGMIKRKMKYSDRQLTPLPLCPTQTSHATPRDLARTPVMRNRR